jgi:hypothetical protein
VRWGEVLNDDGTRRLGGRIVNFKINDYSRCRITIIWRNRPEPRRFIVYRKRFHRTIHNPNRVIGRVKADRCR